jgi:hypothetical protein
MVVVVVEVEVEVVVVLASLLPYLTTTTGDVAY